MSQMTTPTLKVTANQHGIMHQLNPMTERFIQLAAPGACLLDVGCAYGVATLPALQKGAEVIACDINMSHLTEIDANSKSKQLTLLHARFPDFSLAADSVDGILLSHVLPFLSGDSLRFGLACIWRWLKPGGRCFIMAYTIYNALMRRYIPQYQKRKTLGHSWPGEIHDASLYWDKKNPLSQLLPKNLNHYEPSLLQREFDALGFITRHNDWFSCPHCLAQDALLEGREAMMAVIEKPSRPNAC